MKIYTRSGDDGTTSLFGGKRVGKDDARVAAYGTVDELNAVIGVARSLRPDARLDRQLLRIQHELFDCGADLADPLSGTPERPSRIRQEQVERLEQEIDRFSAETPPIKSFILPGGTPLAAALHHARTVARRAERQVVRLSRSVEVAPALIQYLNRLSDWLFAAARAANAKAGTADVEWRSSAAAAAESTTNGQEDAR